MTLDEMLAQAAIRQAMVGFHIAADEQRVDEAGAFFAEDAVFNVVGNIMHGRDAIVAMLKSVAASRAPDAGKRRHNLTTSQIIVNGEEATGRSYFLVVGDKGPDTQGVYTDRFRKVGGRWVIAERQITLDWSGR